MIKVSDRTKTSGYYLNFAADVDIIKDMLSFRLMYGINKENANRNLYIPSDIYFMDMYNQEGIWDMLNVETKPWKARDFQKAVWRFVTCRCRSRYGKVYERFKWS